MRPNPHHPTSEELFAYRDGELSAEKRSLIEAHVIACAQCRERVDEMSSVESDLRLRPDGVGADYYERLTQSVLARVGGTPRPLELPSAKEERAESPRAVERRHPEREIEEADGSRRFRFPWIGVAGTAAAAVAVALVVVVLLQRQEQWIQAPRPGVLGEAEEGAVAPGADSALAKRQVVSQGKAGGTAAVPPGAPLTGSKRAKEEAAKRRLETQSTALKKTEVAGTATGMVEEKDQAAENRARLDAASRTAPGSDASLAPMAMRQAAPVSLPPGDAYAGVIRAHRLPAVWDPSVPRDALLRAESDLRYIYQMGRAGSDSARIRLYLAEAERARLTDFSDNAAVGDIAHDYRRAISLAGSDAALANLARRRLEDFLAEVGVGR